MGSGLNVYGRTERIEGAHTVVVVAGFFEGLSDVRLPTSLTKREQIALGTDGGGSNFDDEPPF